MSLAGCQINPIDVNFHLQKSLEIFDTNSADKIQSQNYKGVKVPCLMPIRVKSYQFSGNNGNFHSFSTCLRHIETKNVLNSHKNVKYGYVKSWALTRVTTLEYNEHRGPFINF